MMTMTCDELSKKEASTSRLFTSGIPDQLLNTVQTNLLTGGAGRSPHESYGTRTAFSIHNCEGGRDVLPPLLGDSICKHHRQPELQGQLKKSPLVTFADSQSDKTSSWRSVFHLQIFYVAVFVLRLITIQDPIMYITDSVSAGAGSPLLETYGEASSSPTPVREFCRDDLALQSEATNLSNFSVPSARADTPAGCAPHTEAKLESPHELLYMLPTNDARWWSSSTCTPAPHVANNKNVHPAGGRCWPRPSDRTVLGLGTHSAPTLPPGPEAGDARSTPLLPDGKAPPVGRSESRTATSLSNSLLRLALPREPRLEVLPGDDSLCSKLSAPALADGYQSSYGAACSSYNKSADTGTTSAASPSGAVGDSPPWQPCRWHGPDRAEPPANLETNALKFAGGYQSSKDAHCSPYDKNVLPDAPRAASRVSVARGCPQWWQSGWCPTRDRGQASRHKNYTNLEFTATPGKPSGPSPACGHENSLSEQNSLSEPCPRHPSARTGETHAESATLAPVEKTKPDTNYMCTKHATTAAEHTEAHLPSVFQLQTNAADACGSGANPASAAPGLDTLGKSNKETYFGETTESPLSVTHNKTANHDKVSKLVCNGACPASAAHELTHRLGTSRVIIIINKASGGRQSGKNVAIVVATPTPKPSSRTPARASTSASSSHSRVGPDRAHLQEAASN